MKKILKIFIWRIFPLVIVAIIFVLMGKSNILGAGGEERIVFSDLGDKLTPEIFCIDINGKNLENLTNHSAGDGPPIPSPNGRFIAFESTRRGKTEVFIMDADGKNPKFLTEDSFMHGASWSPDSKWIAYVKGFHDVVAVNISSGETKMLFEVLPHFVSYPSWSPDGKKVAFSGTDVKPKSDIYTTDIDGKIKKTPADLQQLTDSQESEIYPSWYPDGKKIIFSSIDRDGGGIFVMDSNGANVKQIYKNRAVCCPSWSPDGKKITFSVLDNGIFVMNSDGRNVEQIFKRGWGPKWLGQRFFSVESEGKLRTTWGKIKRDF